MNTMILGLDGATYTVLDPLMAQGVMPSLAKIIGSGTKGTLESVVPALTPPAWTSLMTGRTPGHHGVFDFFSRESEDSTHIRYATSDDVESEMIWSIAARHDKSSISLNFPLMYPAPEIPGYYVPGWIPWKVLRLACHPPGLYDELAALPNFEVRELAMSIELEEKATEGCPEDEYDHWIELHARREEKWFEIFEHLLKKSECELTSVLFDGVDKLQHLCWRFLDPAYEHTLVSERDFKIRERCLDYFRRLDTIIGKIVALAGDNTRIYVASDHGFGPTYEVFNVNAWLEKNGFLSWLDGDGPGYEEALLGVNQVAMHTYTLDWNRTKAYATTPTSNGIFINRGKGGVSDSEYDAFVADLKARLSAATHPESGEQIIKTIWSRDEAFSGQFKGLAPDLTLVMRDGGLVSILPNASTVTTRDQVAGAHRPEGVYIGYGPGIRKGFHGPNLSIIDIAPTVLYSLGIDIPEDLEGKVPEAIFEAETLTHCPIAVGGQTVLKSSDLKPRKNNTELTPDEETEIMDRMRELGYVE